MSDYFSFGSNNYSMGGNPFHNRTQYAFEQATSAHFRQFHELKAEMQNDVLELFRSNEIGFLKAPVKKRCRSLDPVCTLGMNLHEMFAIPNLQLMEQEKKQTKAERDQRIIDQRAQKHAKQVGQKLQQWNPYLKERITVNPQRTLFASRLSYKTTEKDLKYEFERYGIVKSTIIPQDEDGKSKGYGFVEFELQEDFISAYKHANHRRINGRKIIVDYERGRTSLTWRPRRLDGGMGGQTRMTREQYEKYMEVMRQKKIQSNKRERSRQKQKERERSRNKKQKKVRDERDVRQSEKNPDRQYRGHKDRDSNRQKDRDQRKRDRKSKQKKQKKDKKDKKERRD